MKNLKARQESVSIFMIISKQGELFLVAHTLASKAFSLSNFLLNERLEAPLTKKEKEAGLAFQELKVCSRFFASTL